MPNSYEQDEAVPLHKPILPALGKQNMHFLRWNLCAHNKPHETHSWKYCRHYFGTLIKTHLLSLWFKCFIRFSYEICHTNNLCGSCQALFMFQNLYRNAKNFGLPGKLTKWCFQIILLFFVHKQIWH